MATKVLHLKIICAMCGGCLADNALAQGDMITVVPCLTCAKTMQVAAREIGDREGFDRGYEDALTHAVTEGRLT